MLSLLPTDLCLWQAHSMHSIILDLCLLLISAHEWPSSLRQPVAAQFLLANSSQSPHRNWGFGNVAGNRARKYMCAHIHAYIQLQLCGLQGDRLCVINSIQRAAHNCARLLLASRHRYRTDYANDVCGRNCQPGHHQFPFAVGKVEPSLISFCGLSSTAALMALE